MNAPAAQCEAANHHLRRRGASNQGSLICSARAAAPTLTRWGFSANPDELQSFQAAIDAGQEQIAVWFDGEPVKYVILKGEINFPLMFAMDGGPAQHFEIVESDRPDPEVRAVGDIHEFATRGEAYVESRSIEARPWPDHDLAKKMGAARDELELLDAIVDAVRDVYLAVRADDNLVHWIGEVGLL